LHATILTSGTSNRMLHKTWNTRYQPLLQKTCYKFRRRMSCWLHSLDRMRLRGLGKEQGCIMICTLGFSTLTLARSTEQSKHVLAPMANLALKRLSLSLKDTISAILAFPEKTRHCAIHESIGGCKRNDVLERHLRGMPPTQRGGTRRNGL
jgi:hypothetical protein